MPPFAGLQQKHTYKCIGVKSTNQDRKSKHAKVERCMPHDMNTTWFARIVLRCIQPCLRLSLGHLALALLPCLHQLQIGDITSATCNQLQIGRSASPATIQGLTLPELSALRRASSLMMPPRAQLTMITPSFIWSQKQRVYQQSARADSVTCFPIHHQGRLSEYLVPGSIQYDSF